MMLYSTRTLNRPDNWNRMEMMKQVMTPNKSYAGEAAYSQIEHLTNINYIKYNIEMREPLVFLFRLAVLGILALTYIYISR